PIAHSAVTRNYPCRRNPHKAVNCPEPSEYAAVEDRDVLHEQQVAGKEHSARRVENGQIVVSVRRGPCFDDEASMPQIKFDLVIDDKRRRHDLHVIKCRFHLAAKRVDIEWPICRECSWQVVVTDKNSRRVEGHIAEDMVRMSVGIYDILD